MQSSNEKNKKNSAAPWDSELSATWQALLSGQATAASDLPQVQHLTASDVQQVQQLVSDPWSHLLNSRGMQPVDLQKVRLHHPQGDDHDVEHALDIMR